LNRSFRDENRSRRIGKGRKPRARRAVPGCPAQKVGPCKAQSLSQKRDREFLQSMPGETSWLFVRPFTTCSRVISNPSDLPYHRKPLWLTRASPAASGRTAIRRNRRDAARITLRTAEPNWADARVLLRWLVLLGATLRLLTVRLYSPSCTSDDRGQEKGERPLELSSGTHG
jgi:hypothetical protein